MDTEVLMPRRAAANLYFDGPFAGFASDVHPQNLPMGVAVSCDNCHSRNGDLRARPGTCEAPGGGDVTAASGLLSMRYQGSDRDYVIATAEGRAFLQRYNALMQMEPWTQMTPPRKLPSGSGAIERFGRVSYLSFGDGVYKYRGELDVVALEDAGMEALDTGLQAINVTNSGASGFFWDNIDVWVSRYNSVTGVESNAVLGGSLTSLSARKVQVEITNMDVDLRGDATHIRIYQSRNTGRGYPGLIAEVEIDAHLSGTTFTYEMATENNGGSTYALATDDTSYAAVAPQQNGVPPAALDIALHDGRMFYATEGGVIRFSQSITETQGGVEAVAALSERVVPRNEEIVALRSYQDALYVFTGKQVYRFSGVIASLTNEQVVLGSDVFDDPSTDVREGIENSAGCVSRDSIIEIDTPEGSLLFYAGPDNLMVFNGASAAPITIGVCQDLYRSRLLAAGTGHISACHHAESNLIIWCFRNVGCIAYDYFKREFWLFDSFQMNGSDQADCFGPIATRNVHNRETSQALLARQKDGTLSDYQFYVFDINQADDDGHAFPITWTGPQIDGQLPQIEKRWHYVVADFASQLSGSVTVEVRLNGDSSKIFSKTFDQTKITSRTPPRKGLHARARHMQPVFTLAGNSRLLGYGFHVNPVGRR